MSNHSAITREQSLDARPVAVRIVRRSPLPGGGERVAVPLRPSRWQKFLLRIPDDATKEFELDAVGVELLGLCDGEHSVKDLAREFSRKHQVGAFEAQQAVSAFMQTLIAKGLVVVVIGK